MRIWLAVLLWALLSGVAHGAPLLSFDTPAGTVYWDGTGDPIEGEEIVVSSIQALGTPRDAGLTLDCVGCEMEFHSGPAISKWWNDTPTSGFQLVVGEPGGFVTVTGAIPAFGLPPDTLLLEGAWTDAPAHVFVNEPVLHGVFMGTGTATVHPVLAGHFRLEPTGFAFEATSEYPIRTVEWQGDYAFWGDLTGGGLEAVGRVAQQQEPVPLPGPVVLYLLGVLLMRRMWGMRCTR
jgi:hypothetical protein